MKKGVVIAIVVAVIILAIGVFLLINSKFRQNNAFPVDYSHEYPASSSDIAGFEMKKTGSNFLVYYHSEDDKNANKALAVLEQAGMLLYQKYLGFSNQNISVFLASDIDEYVRIADFPGGKENVAVGDGSAPNGKIYVYRAFQEGISGKTEGMLIHEGVHASIYQFLEGKMQFLPGFLNEGFAHYIEFVFKAGENFSPLSQIYHSDLLIQGIETGTPKILSLDELAQECEGYISEDTLNFLCRGEGTFAIWYINKNYGEQALNNFLAGLKQTRDWQTALSSATGKTISQLGQEINDNLKSEAEKK